MIEADDGGVTITVDDGATWSLQNNQPTGQFYHVTTDNEFNYYIYGAQQDASTVAIRGRTDTGAITESDWHTVGGGESGYIWPDPRDPEIIFAGDHNGHFTQVRRTHRADAGHRSVVRRARTSGFRIEAPLPVDRADGDFSATIPTCSISAANAFSRRPTAA